MDGWMMDSHGNSELWQHVIVHDLTVDGAIILPTNPLILALVQLPSVDFLFIFFKVTYQRKYVKFHFLSTFNAELASYLYMSKYYTLTGGEM